MKRFLGFSVGILVLSAGCSDTVTVEFSAGCTSECGTMDSPLAFELSTASIALPTELRDDTDSTIGEVPCGPMGMCPSTAEVPITCEGGLCDPAPVTLAVPVGDVIDFQELEEGLRDVFTSLERIEILSVQYQIALNTLTLGVNEVEVYWGPAAATSIDPDMGVRLLGTVPPLGPAETRAGDVEVDPAGQEALSDHVVGVASQVRFFAETQVDLNPGDPWPEGSLRVNVAIRIRAVGSAL